VADGIYAAANGMAAQQGWLDAIANDIANVDTNGYRQTRVAFHELVDGGGAASTPAGRSLRPGALNQTGDPLSLAIQGPGFFAVKTADGRTALTRDGALQVDASGTLVTTGGLRLEPPIDLPRGADPSNVQIASDGTVRLAGKELGRVRVLDVPAPESLVSAGDGLFVATAASGEPVEAKGATIVQGAVEASNVDLGAAMTDLVQAQRAYELQSRVLKSQDELLEIVNGIRR